MSSAEFSTNKITFTFLIEPDNKLIKSIVLSVYLGRCTEVYRSDILLLGVGNVMNFNGGHPDINIIWRNYR